MKPTGTGPYRIREFAALAGVTARALRHYERVGLLKPRRTQAGYRVYSAGDFALLEQIVALKFIGFPLSKIRSLLRREESALAPALRAQRAILEHKRALLDKAIAAVGEAEDTMRAGRRPDEVLFRRIIEVIEMQNQHDEWKKQYDGLVQAKIGRLQSMSPELRADLQKQWGDLFAEIRAALNDDPGSRRAQTLATRWLTLLAAFAPDGALDPQLVKKFGSAYQGRDASRAAGPLSDARVWEFIGKALAMR